MVEIGKQFTLIHLQQVEQRQQNLNFTYIKKLTYVGFFAVKNKIFT